MRRVVKLDQTGKIVLDLSLSRSNEKASILKSLQTIAARTVQAGLFLTIIIPNQSFLDGPQAKAASKDQQIATPSVKTPFNFEQIYNTISLRSLNSTDANQSALAEMVLNELTKVSPDSEPDQKSLNHLRQLTASISASAAGAGLSHDVGLVIPLPDAISKVKQDAVMISERILQSHPEMSDKTEQLAKISSKLAIMIDFPYFYSPIFNQAGNETNALARDTKVAIAMTDNLTAAHIKLASQIGHNAEILYMPGHQPAQSNATRLQVAYEVNQSNDVIDFTP